MLTPQQELILFSRLPGTGAGLYWSLLDHFPSLHAALQASDETLQKLLPPDTMAALRLWRDRGEASNLHQRVMRDCEWLEQNSVELVDMDHSAYPDLLREIKRAPPLLYVKGNLSCLSLPQVAIVGSRNPTPAGRDTAHSFGQELARNGFTITSGMALGIDSAAHRGALAAHGRTLAVLGTGIDMTYPQRNADLAAAIVGSGGALVSEFPLETGPQPQNFPQRNRIVSGLSYGVLVVEAAVKSGSLISARYALQQDRELFAIPGSIHNPLSRGCHALIKDGAKLVETAAEIVEELGGFLAMEQEKLELDKVPEFDEARLQSEIVSTEVEGDVLAQLDYNPVSIDILAERTHLPVGEVMSCLLTMELKGLVANMGSGYMRVR